MTAKLDLDTLKLDKNSYLTEELKESFADVVYNCIYLGDSDVELKIALLFEHKSRVESFPHIQLLKYILGIWSHNIKHKQPLQVVIPLIFYHGIQKWELLEFREYFKGADSSLHRFIPEFSYLLTDLANYDEEAIRDRLFQRESSKAVMLLFKYIFNEDYLTKNLSAILESGVPFLTSRDGAGFLKSIILYLLNSAEISSEAIIDTIKKISQQGGDFAMTAAVQLRKEGKIEGKVEDAINMLADGLLSVAKIAEYTGLSEEEIRKL